jgi:O-acetyl-ADP-ribose deacetylase (regulator of RNase III)
VLYEVSGDLLLSRAQVLAHGVAPNDPMSQGLALALHEKYPAMHKDFHHWCSQQHPKPGSAWMWGGPGGVRVVNLLTQEGGYGHGARPGKATLANVRSALRALAKMIEAEAFTSVALPRLATGVGGLEWEDVWPIVRERLGDAAIPIIVYSEFRPGQRAQEPALEA